MAPSVYAKYFMVEHRKAFWMFRFHPNSFLTKFLNMRSIMVRSKKDSAWIYQEKDW